MRLLPFLLLLPLLAFGQTGHRSLSETGPSTQRRSVVLDDFESYKADGLPTKWLTNQASSDLVPVSPAMMNDRERYIIKQEKGNKFVRAEITDEAHRLVMLNDQQMHWNLKEFPYLRWDWRAIELPAGAREDQRGKNDTGAAVYVTFGRDWLGRPKSIKYTYSSTLPVGSVASYGPLKVLVVSSAVQDGTGKWLTIERNVVEDYRQLFGKEPDDEPVGIILWSDSDTMDSVSEADFDNLTLLSAPPAP